MPLNKLQFKPGIDKQNTQYGAEGGWVDCDMVRFRYGVPEKIGGWEPAIYNNIIGVARDIHVFTDLNDNSLAGIGTDRKLYVYFDNQAFDITPLSTTIAANFTFTANSTTVSVSTIPANGAVAGDFVTFTTVSGVSVINFTNANMQQEFEIQSIVNSTTFTVNVGSIATPGVVTTSGSSAGAQFQINIGSETTIAGQGWGAGFWNQSTWGTPRPKSVIVSSARVWALDNFGEDLLATVKGGKTFKLDTSAFIASYTTTTTRATLVSDAPAKSNFMIVSPRDRHVIFLGTETTPNTSSSYDPMSVLFGSQESLTDFTPNATNTAGFQRLSDGSIIQTAIRTRGDILILTDTSAHAMQFVGPPFTFSFKQIGSNCGALGTNCSIEAQNVVYWMSFGSFYMFDGVVKQIPCSVQDYVFTDINLTQSDVFYCGSNAKFGEVTWFYVSLNSVNIDRMVTYNYKENVWTIGTLARTVWADKSVFEAPLATKYLPNSTTLATPTVVGLTDGISTLYNQETGVNDDTDPITAFITSGDVDIVDGDNSLFIKRYIPDMKNQEGAVNFQFLARQYPGSVQTVASSTLAYSTTTKVDVRVRARQIAVKIISTDIDTKWRMGTLRIDGQQDGLR
jgi:hypothetical protein